MVKRLIRLEPRTEDEILFAKMDELKERFKALCDPNVNLMRKLPKWKPKRMVRIEKKEGE